MFPPIRSLFEPSTRPLRTGEDPSWFGNGRAGCLALRYLLFAALVIRLVVLWVSSPEEAPVHSSHPKVDGRTSVSLEVPAEAAGMRCLLEWRGAEGVLGRATAFRRAREGELLGLSLVWFPELGAVLVGVDREDGTALSRSLSTPGGAGAHTTQRWVHPGVPNARPGDALLRLAPEGTRLPTDPAAPDPPGVISLRCVFEP